MKFYIVNCDKVPNESGPDTSSNVPCVSQVEVSKERKRLTEMGVKRRDVHVYELDVPTNKDGLTHFLRLLLSQQSTSEGIAIAATEHALTR